MSNEKSDHLRGAYVVVFAGPNGSGKTSLIDELKQTGLATFRGAYPLPSYFINPDQVAKDLVGNFSSQDARDEAAQLTAMRLRAEAMASGQSFAFETVMSHPSRINEMLMLKQQGYRLFLTFITTDHPQKNVARVTFRYETGTTTGHYVAPEKVRERYHRTLALLPRAAEIADAVYIYDNSADFEKPKLQAIIERDVQFSVLPSAKNWVLQRLVRPLQEREREMEQLTLALTKAGQRIMNTDELQGTYIGPILSVTSHYLAQLETASKQAVIHDRIMLDAAHMQMTGAASPYWTKESITIRYSPTHAPKVERSNFSLKAVKEKPVRKRTRPKI